MPEVKKPDTPEAEANAPASLVDDTLQTAVVESQIEVRDADKRELGIFIVPWNTVVETNLGPEMFVPGAFSDIDPTKVRLRMDHENPATGKGLSLEERDDGAHMGFRVSKTSRGDDQLALVADGTETGASVGFHEVPGGTVIEQRNGRRVRVHRKVDLREVSTTWQPAYERATVTYMRSEDKATAVAEPSQEVVPVADETTAAPANGATEAAAPAAPQFDMTALTSSVSDSITSAFKPVIHRLDQLEERSRSQFVVPGSNPKNAAKLYDWASVAVRMLKGGRIDNRELQERDLQDVITPENPGQVPDAFLNDVLGLINPRRPFLSSTTQITAPGVGMSLVVPVIQQHSSADVQSAEKTDIDSTALKVTTASYDAVTIAGGADVSIQMLKRADPSFFDLLTRDLSAAYAQVADNEAVDALLAAGISSGGALDPEDLTIGGAWTNSMTVTGNAPDTIWLSSAAVADFIDAKSDGTNRPLYFNLNANFAAGTGTGGNVSALTPVYTPSLDHTGIDVLVGPKAGFAWAEDGTFTLQADVPSKAGRDIAIVGILFFVPRYSTAFTGYSVSGGGS